MVSDCQTKQWDNLRVGNTLSLRRTNFFSVIYFGCAPATCQTLMLLLSLPLHPSPFVDKVLVYRLQSLSANLFFLSRHTSGIRTKVVYGDDK